MHTLQEYLGEGARILEIGCGTGEFCIQGQREGFKIEAVEMSESLADYVQSELGIDCFKGRIEEFDRQGKYDAIVAFDVIEHLADPSFGIGQR